MSMQPKIKIRPTVRTTKKRVRIKVVAGSKTPRANNPNRITKVTRSRAYTAPDNVFYSAPERGTRDSVVRFSEPEPSFSAYKPLSPIADLDYESTTHPPVIIKRKSCTFIPNEQLSNEYKKPQRPQAHAQMGQDHSDVYESKHNYVRIQKSRPDAQFPSKSAPNSPELRAIRSVSFNEDPPDFSLGNANTSPHNSYANSRPSVVPAFKRPPSVTIPRGIAPVRAHSKSIPTSGLPRVSISHAPSPRRSSRPPPRVSIAYDPLAHGDDRRKAEICVNCGSSFPISEGAMYQHEFYCRAHYNDLFKEKCPLCNLPLKSLSEQSVLSDGQYCHESCAQYFKICGTDLLRNSDESQRLYKREVMTQLRHTQRFFGQFGSSDNSPLDSPKNRRAGSRTGGFDRDTCAACGYEITNKTGRSLRALDDVWHAACFACAECQCSLVSQQFQVHGRNVYCVRDYNELFSSRCSRCHQIISGQFMNYETFDEHEGKIMNAVHVPCFTCAVCDTNLNGEQFFVDGHDVFCRSDYDHLLNYSQSCNLCGTFILGTLVSVGDTHYHHNCFICAKCNGPPTGEFFEEEGTIQCIQCPTVPYRNSIYEPLEGNSFENSDYDGYDEMDVMHSPAPQHCDPYIQAVEPIPPLDLQLDEYNLPPPPSSPPNRPSTAPAKRTSIFTFENIPPPPAETPPPISPEVDTKADGGDNCNGETKLPPPPDEAPPDLGEMPLTRERSNSEPEDTQKITSEPEDIQRMPSKSQDVLKRTPPMQFRRPQSLTSRSNSRTNLTRSETLPPKSSNTKLPKLSRTATLLSSSQRQSFRDGPSSNPTRGRPFLLEDDTHTMLLKGPRRHKFTKDFSKEKQKRARTTPGPLDLKELAAEQTKPTRNSQLRKANLVSPFSKLSTSYLDNRHTEREQSMDFMTALNNIDADEAAKMTPPRNSSRPESPSASTWNASELSTNKHNKARIGRGIEKYDIKALITVGMEKCYSNPLSILDRSDVKKFRGDYGGKAVYKLKDEADVVSYDFEDYSPSVFNNIRKVYGISQEDFKRSLCAQQVLGGTTGAGKSGMLFFTSADKKYIIKTLTRSELKYFQQILQKYHMHLLINPHTLLSRFYAMHKIILPGLNPIRFVVMNNVFETTLPITSRYDLKGSTQNRIVGEQELSEMGRNPVLKDLNFRDNIYCGPAQRKALERQIRVDSMFLQKANIMDFSLLLGVNDGGGTKAVHFNLDKLSKPIKEFDYKSIFQLNDGGIASQHRGEPHVYFMGIIDILQEFNLRKKMEYRLKSVRFNADTISAIESKRYAERFRNFIISKLV